MKSKSPRLLIQEDLLDTTTLRKLGRVTPQGEKVPLQEIEYQQDKKISQISQIPEEELAKAIHTLLSEQEK